MVSVEEFRTACSNFLELSRKPTESDSYLEKREVATWPVDGTQRLRYNTLCYHSYSPVEDIGESSGDKVSEIDFDSECAPKRSIQNSQQISLSPKANRKLVILVYQIVFNHAFAVPQLFFNAQEIDGSIIPLQVFHDLIPKHMLSGEIESEVWSSLSQTEHPILRTPFYTLHPCRTKQFIQKFEKKSPSWLVSWLSSIGPAIGLHLSNSYGNVLFDGKFVTKLL